MLINLENRREIHQEARYIKDIITRSFHMLYLDLFGPMNVMYINKKKYDILIVDDFRRFTWIFFLSVLRIKLYNKFMNL